MGAGRRVREPRFLVGLGSGRLEPLGLLTLIVTVQTGKRLREYLSFNLKRVLNKARKVVRGRVSRPPARAARSPGRKGFH